MFARRSPLCLSRAPAPSVADFASAAAREAGFQGAMLSVMPLVMERALQDPTTLWGVDLAAGITSPFCGLLVQSHGL